MTDHNRDQAAITRDFPALKIGTRVCCTDDGVQGRITWANGVAVKIQWDDGEQVTWRRDSLAGRHIMIPDSSSQEQTPMASALRTDQEPTDLPADATVDRESSKDPTALTTAADSLPLVATVVSPLESPSALASQSRSVEVTAEQNRSCQTSADPKGSKLSALDAAAKVLEETAQPMSCQELIQTMASKGYWTSPECRTPQATLYAVMAKEIATKGIHSRFVKTGRGKFARAQRT